MATRVADELEDRVRARLRQARFERGLSVHELARAAGVAPSTVSRLETGRRRLTVTHVAQLAEAMGMAAEELLTDGCDRAVRARAHDGKRWEPVGPERTDGPRVYRVGMVPDVAGPAATEPELHSHEGHQSLLVLEGAVRLVVEHNDVTLHAGESAEFHTWRPHWLGAVDGPAEALIVFTPDGRPRQALSDTSASG